MVVVRVSGDSMAGGRGRDVLHTCCCFPSLLHLVNRRSGYCQEDLQPEWLLASRMAAPIFDPLSVWQIWLYGEYDVFMEN